jgi:hypothetical protein
MMAQSKAADKSETLATAVEDLRAFVRQAAQQGSTFHDFEDGLFKRLLEMGRQAVGLFLALLGPGDLGESLTLPEGKEVRRLEETHDRDLTCLFGTFTLKRTCYGSREGQKIDFVPLDNRLALPEGKCSYLLEDTDQLLACEHPYDKVCQALKRLLRLEQHVDTLERQSRRMAEAVEPFRKQQAPPEPSCEGEVLVQQADGKGIPMRKPQAANAQAKRPAKRAGKKGAKPGRKKMAVVGCAYTVDRYVRSPEQVLAALFGDPAPAGPCEPRPRPCHKRVCARLREYQGEDGQRHFGLVDVFGWLTEQRNARDGEGSREVVNVMDGEEKLWEAMDVFQGHRPSVDVLDILHVTPRLWRAAELFYPKGSAQAEQMARDRVLRVLRGEVKGVIRGLRRMGSQRGLKGAKKKELGRICNYLQRNGDKMRYDEYLKAGYPIASGAIEGACRHYVKDRMERSGMSWVKPGAQAMLQLRATALNGDWDEFVAFRIEYETQRLYPHRHMVEDVSWPLAV